MQHKHHLEIALLALEAVENDNLSEDEIREITALIKANFSKVDIHIKFQTDSRLFR